MRRLLCVLFLLAGCALETPPPSTGFLPDDAFGATVQGEDIAVAATGTALVAFANPASLRGDPADMALAVASLDAMAGQFRTGGRWLGMDQFVKLQMLDARDKVRAVLGVPAAADSQGVIDALVAAAHALQRHDQAAALAAVSAPEFTFGPARTLALLTAFPYMQAANVATQAANQDLFPTGGDSSPF